MFGNCSNQPGCRTSPLIALHDANAALRLLEYLEAHPIIEIRKTVAALGATFKTVSGAVESLRAAGILVQTSAGRRNRLFAYEAYLALLRDGT